MAGTHDYVNRSPSFEAMNMWEFSATQEICKLEESRELISDDENSSIPEVNLFYMEDSDIHEVDDIEMRNSAASVRHRFLREHPLYQTYGHRQRTRRTWPKYSAKRLPDVVDLQDGSDLSDEDRNEKRELYVQGVLIMFYPFRKIADLKEDDNNWWTAYLKKKTAIESNSATVATLNSIQNFYESFCRSGPQSDQPNHVIDDPHQITICDNSEDDEPNDVLDLLDAEQELHQAEVLYEFCRCTDDPFVKKLVSLDSNPIQIHRSPPELDVNLEDAMKAICELPRTGRSFQLPNRAKLGDCVNDHNQSSDPLSSPVLDKPMGTRIDLLAHLERALGDATHTVTTCDGTEPIILESNFPTLNEQSKHWSLNAKQHQAFLLAGAALLQHISKTNSIDPSNQTTSCRNLTTAITEHLNILLPKDGQLIMYLGGSGGTGKSRVIQAFVDFSRRWLATASTVITASSGVAAVLIGGCTIHSALGFKKSMKPGKPTPAMMAAWSEIGVMFIDEFGMVKADLYDLIDTRLRELKGRPDKPYGGVHMIYSGDFYQLPPVGSSLFTPPTRQENANNENALSSMRGRDKWLKLTTDTIELLENHRQTDTSWAESQQRWRINQPTKQDIEDVNSRYLESHSDNYRNQPTTGTIAAVPENLTRTNSLLRVPISVISPANRAIAIRLAQSWLNFNSVESGANRRPPVYSARTN